MDAHVISKENLSKRIAGEIVLSSNAGKTIQKWRNIFKIPQRRLADEIGIMPSVISDYENGRRKSPGIKVINKLVSAMISIDEKRGSKIIKDFSKFPEKTVRSSAILDLKEFDSPINIKKFCEKIGAQIVIEQEGKIHGYTVIDSIRAITELPPLELAKVYGFTTERALIFTGAHTGKSSMVAIKITNLKPGLVVLHGAEKVDELAKRIGQIEGIPISICKEKDVDKLLKNLKKIR